MRKLFGGAKFVAASQVALLSAVSIAASPHKATAQTVLEGIVVEGGAVPQAGGPADAADGRGEPTAASPVEGYVARRSATGSKTDTPIQEIPQAISVVGRDQIVDQGSTSIQDALRYTPGVFAQAYGFSTRGDWARIRGASPTEYLDGMRRLNGFYNNTRPDPYTLERIEVLKGPAAVLYGQGSTAGIVNLVSKRPDPNHRNEIGVQYGSFDRKQVEADIGGKLTEDGSLAYRMIGVVLDSDSQVDFVHQDRYLFAPSVTWRPDASTSLTVLGNFQKDDSAAGAQFLPIEGTLFAGPNGFIPISRFSGEPSYNQYDSEQASVTALFETELSETFTLRQNVRYTDSKNDYKSAYPSVYANPANPFADPQRRSVFRDLYESHPHAKTFTSDTHVEAKVTTGFVSQKLLAGFDYVNFRESGTSGYAFQGGAPLDLYAPVYGSVLTPPQLFENPDVDQSSRGFYLQDQIKAGPWIAVLGVRRDQITNKSEGSPTEEHEGTTYRAGLMYELPFGLTPYASYSESLTPVSGTDFFNQAFAPILGEQVEAGFKFAPQGFNMVVNGAVYEILEQNRLAADPTNPFNQVQSGEARFRGYEIEVIGEVFSGLEIMAGYAYTDAVVLAGYGAGFRVETVPEHQASLWAKYSFNVPQVPGLISVGAGVRYIGESWDGADNFVTPEYTLFDAMVGYETDEWRFAINGKNLEDKEHLATCLARGDCFIGERRTIMTSLTYKY
ncbi:MAG: TonB-dependent siderophore receptor [Hyphomicrobiaceae bacterium]|nr:TonB-dependent siderophore receptor [Hyphomicrobiaceae bacterium]